MLHYLNIGSEELKGKKQLRTYKILNEKNLNDFEFRLYEGNELMNGMLM